MGKVKIWLPDLTKVDRDYPVDMSGVRRLQSKVAGNILKSIKTVLDSNGLPDKDVKRKS